MLSAQGALAAADEVSFRPETIDPEIGKVCYAVTVADVNGDGRPDVVAVSERAVYWYENPSWKRRVIIEDQTTPDNVCIAPHDIDGDGQVDFALGAGWLGKHVGEILWLSRGESPDKPWRVHRIGAEPWLHRMRWADVLGTGQPQLVVSPLNATTGDGVRLTAFEVPQDPARDRWPSTVLNAEFNRMHNHWHDVLGDGDVVETITASQEGLHRIYRVDGEFQAEKLAGGAAGDTPAQQGAGEVKTGRLEGGAQFLTSIEPMHGTMLAVYWPPAKDGELWQRNVIDQGFRRGHALWTADVNGDGSDEIVMGHSDTPDAPGINVYYAAEGKRSWQKQVVDEGQMATEDLLVHDLNGDGRPEIIAGGRQTQNVMIFWND